MVRNGCLAGAGLDTGDVQREFGGLPGGNRRRHFDALLWNGSIYLTMPRAARRW